MAKPKTDRKAKAIEEMDRIQSQHGGRLPEHIIMLFADRLNRMTKVLIVLTAVLAVLTIVHIYLLVR